MSSRYPLIDYCGKLAGMDQHRDVLAPQRRREAKLDWQADRAQLLEELHKTMDRLYAMQPEYYALLECARMNIQDADALANQLNTVATRFGFLPMSKRTMEWRAIQRQRSPTPKPGCMR